MLNTLQAIITRSALEYNFPTPLVSVAEQIYVSALTLGFEKHDDAGMVRTYYTHPISKVPEWSQPGAEEEAKAIELTVTLLKAIHLWAAAEAIAFAKYLNIDLDQFYELCKDAAGGSVMFRTVGPAMMKKVSVKSASGEANGVPSGQKLADVVEALDEVVMRASKLQAPLHLGSAVRNLMMLAMKRLGSDAADSELIKFWEQQ
jgi:3-hydroxyisobutyrate dehydrogenase